MKKVLALVLCALISLSLLAGCSSSKKPAAEFKWITVDVNDAACVWSDGWNGDANRWGNEPGSYVEFTFEGTGFRWWGGYNVNHGIAEISLDGEVIVEGLNCYASDNIGGQIKYQLTGLEKGTHVVRIEATDFMDERSADCYQETMQFQYTTDFVEWIVVDVNSSACVWSYDWKGDANRWGNVVGGYGEFTFEGTGVRWVGEYNYNHGMALIILDGQVMVEGLDCYGTEIVDDRVKYEITGLEKGTHTLRIETTEFTDERSADVYLETTEFQYR